MLRRLAAAAALLLLTAVALPSRPAAAADSQTIFVNSTRFGLNGTCIPGADEYSPAGANECTLAAALLLANATATSEHPITVTLASGFAASVPDGTPAMIQPVWLTTEFMTLQDGNRDLPGAHAIYVVGSNITLDLQNKLGIHAISGALTTTIYVMGSNVQLLNLSEIRSAQTAISIGPGVSNVLIQGGRTLPTDGFHTHQWVAVGVDTANLTFRDLELGNFYGATTWGDDEGCVSATLCFGMGGFGEIRNVLIERVSFGTTLDATHTACTLTDSSGCVPNAIVFNDYGGQYYDGFTVRDCDFTNLYKTFSSPTVISAAPGPSYDNTYRDFSFTRNTVLNSGAGCGYPAWCAAIYLPYGMPPMQGSNLIANNTFVTDASRPVSHAIGYFSNTGADLVSNLVIRDNHMDGFAMSAVYLVGTGYVTVERNTFGTRQVSQTNTTAEETIVGDTLPALQLNQDYRANQRIQPWYPVSAVAERKAGSCQARVQVAAGVGSAPPITTTAPLPVRVDSYWTSERTAERFLGSSDALVAGGEITVDIPWNLVAADGTIAGGLRLQTQSMGTAQYASSQFSRVTAITGRCDPPVAGELSVQKRAWLDAADLTYGQIMAPDTPATEVPSGGWLPSGVQVTWTYTVRFTNPDPGTTGKLGMTNLTLTDDQLGEVCVIDTIAVNTPIGCVASGAVQ